MKKIFAVAALAAITVSTAAVAGVTFNSDGTGFVGKGDVQLLFGLNNAQIQANAGTVAFTHESVSLSEVEWTCTNSRNENVQERARTTTVTTTGVVSSAARVNKQVTGFNLTGFGASSSTSTTDGPPLNSCPNAASGWYLSAPAGDPVVTTLGGGLSVSYNGSAPVPIG